MYLFEKAWFRPFKARGPVYTTKSKKSPRIWYTIVIMLPHHVPDHFWSDDDSDHSLPGFFFQVLPTCCQLCCQLVANLLPTCCQLVGNNLATNDFVISQRIWACHAKKIFDYLLMWIREDSTHPSLIPRWRKVVVSPRLTPSHPPPKCAPKASFRGPRHFFQKLISQSWVGVGWITKYLAH